MNLIKADLFHLRHDRVFWILLAVIAAIPVASCIMMDSLFGGFGVNAESVIMQGISADILPAILGIAISSFVGRDYASHTIRNKLCYGEKRHKIMAVNFFMGFLITAVFLAVSFASALLSAGFFGEASISGSFWGKYLCQSAILFSFSMLVTAVVVCTKSEKAGFLFTVIAAVLLSAFSYLLPMLARISGVARVVCRSLYMVVSTMLVNSADGVYTSGSGVVFDHMFLNALIMSFAYAALSIGTACVVVRKQSYK